MSRGTPRHHFELSRLWLAMCGEELALKYNRAEICAFHIRRSGAFSRFALSDAQIRRYGLRANSSNHLREITIDAVAEG